MVRRELLFYCVLCREHKKSRKYDSPASYAEFEAAFVFNTACNRPNRLCGPCTEKLRRPLEIVLKDGTVRRAVRVTSRSLDPVVPRSEQTKPRGLVAVDPIPADAFMPYPGKIVKAVDYERFKKKFKFELSHEWSKGGPKDSGTPSVLFGQFTRASKRSMAQYINCAKGLKKPGNCKWGQARVTPQFRKTYPGLDQSAVVDDQVYPGVRVKKDIAPGEELLITTYGSQFWPRMKREREGSVKVSRPIALSPAFLRALDQDDEGLRRGRKRARKE